MTASDWQIVAGRWPAFGCRGWPGTGRVEVGLPHVLRGALKAQVGMESCGECLVADVRPRR